MSLTFLQIIVMLKDDFLEKVPEFTGVEANDAMKMRQKSETK